MTEITFKTTPEVTLVDYHGSDASIVAAARVSVAGGEEAQYLEHLNVAKTKEYRGLINYLMTHRHGTPFEHNSITFRVAAPIFVFREWHRHRVPWSYNEESGRYKQLDPVFHIPGPARPLINVGTSARPQMVPGSFEQWEKLRAEMEEHYILAYRSYERSLAAGITKEVAREVLPVGIFSTMYATANLRGILHFLSLRIHDPEAKFVSYPQYEIQQAAQQVENIVKKLFPIAYSCYIDNGRVAP